MNAAVFVLTAWLTADMLSGLFHWWEDRYGNPEWPVLGPLVVAPNVRHHAEPLAFLAPGMVERNWTAFVPSWTAAAVAWWMGCDWAAVALGFLGMSNEVHAWAHQKCSRPIRGLQLLGVLQSQEQHAAHHRQPFDKNFCVMTDWCNPVLAAVGFWPALEAAIWFVSGVAPLPSREVA